jgi:hypothetical protein
MCFLLLPVQFVTLWSRRRGLGPYVQFTDSSESLDPNWHPEQIEIMDRQTNFKVRRNSKSGSSSSCSRRSSYRGRRVGWACCPASHWSHIGHSCSQEHG